MRNLENIRKNGNSEHIENIGTIGNSQKYCKIWGTAKMQQNVGNVENWEILENMGNWANVGTYRQNRKLGKCAKT